MPVGEGLRLSIDCGAASTVGAFVGADGAAEPVLVDGSPLLSSGVFVDPRGGGLVVGATAWLRATTRPDCFEPSPVRRISEGRIPLGSREVDVVDMVAATLARVAGDAAAGGRVVDEVTLVVPAGWGPQRRTLLRKAAHRAGLRQPALVEAPVAVAWQLVSNGVDIPAGGCVLVCDMGAGFEATAVRRNGDGFEVLAVSDDRDAGGGAIDAAVAAYLADAAVAVEATAGQQAAPAPGAVDGADTLVALADARAAKEALSRSVSVLVSVAPSLPPMVVDAARLRALAAPVLERAATVARRAVEAAEVPAEEFVGLFCVGGSAGLPFVADALGEAVGMVATTPARPQLAAVLGSLRVGPPGDAPPTLRERVPVPVRVRDNLRVLLPAVASLALLVQFLFTTDRYGETGPYQPEPFLVANWGLLAMAAVFAMLATLAAATVGVGALYPDDVPAARRPGSRLLGTVLPGAAGVGLTIAAVYAIIGAVYFDVPAGPLLGWALWSTLPLAAAATAVGLLAFWRPSPPGGSWAVWLGFPYTPVVVAGAGMMLLQAGMTATVPVAWLDADIASRTGAAVLGVGIGLVAARRLRYQLLACGLFAVASAAVVTFPTLGLLGAGFAAAASAWWFSRAARLALAPLIYQTTPVHAATRVPTPRPAEPDPANPAGSATVEPAHSEA